MMISPEAYYEFELKGKNKSQIISIIRGLKSKIGHLKNCIEHPDYGNEPICHPSEQVRISCYREYLEKAKQTLSQVGGTYHLSQSEIRTVDFQDNIQYISRITFEIGGFFDGMTKHILNFNEASISLTSLRFDVQLEEKIIDKQEVLSSLEKLYIGEWHRYYDPKRFGYVIMDGTQWSVAFDYNNGHHSITIGGSNDYPYNFDDFVMLFSAQEDIETDANVNSW